MLISHDEVVYLLKERSIHIHGALHIGAHECEELGFYAKLGLKSEDLIWIDAMQHKVDQAKARGIPNVYQGVMSENDDEVVDFNISNNGQSSSMLEFGTHSTHHPHVHYIDKHQLLTQRVDTFFMKNALDARRYDFWNLDIQGAELLALKGGMESLKHVKAIYLEVNTEKVYKDCALIGDIDMFLGAFGFIRIRTEITEFNWGDALYVKEDC
jgi:hypothetical protein